MAESEKIMRSLNGYKVHDDEAVRSVGGVLPDENGNVQIEGMGTDAESVVNHTRSVQTMVTFVDDDGESDVWDKLKPLSEQYGIPFVAAVATDYIGQAGRMTAEQLVALQNMGWEIASHTKEHAELGSMTDEEQEEQLRASKEALEALGVRCDTICYPYSSVSENTWEIARKYYRCGRQTNYKEWLNESPLETWDLRTTPLGSYYETRTESGLDTSTPEYYKYQVDRAVSGNAWLIFMTHCSETDDTQMGYLAQIIEYVQSLGIPIVTIREAMDMRGNIVDTGHYDRVNPENGHFVVGCDGAVEKSAPDKYAVNLPVDAVTNDTPPSWFPWNMVSTCKVTGNTAGFPYQSHYYGGTLITNTMGAAAVHDLKTKDYTEGRVWQEFYIPKSVAVYRRYAVDADTWSEWSYGSDVVLAQDSRAIDSVVSEFPKGVKSKVWITQDGTSEKRLDGTNGWLITDRTDINEKVQHQTWIPMVKNNPKGNVYFRRWTGSEWDVWTCLGERTGTTDMLSWSFTPKYVGACVFDTTLGRPVWYNGTAWVGATEVDETLSVSGAAADAKAVGDKLNKVTKELVFEYSFDAAYANKSVFLGVDEDLTWLTVKNDDYGFVAEVVYESYMSNYTNTFTDACATYLESSTEPACAVTLVDGLLGVNAKFSVCTNGARELGDGNDGINTGLYTCINVSTYGFLRNIKIYRVSK